MFPTICNPKKTFRIAKIERKVRLWAGVVDIVMSLYGRCTSCFGASGIGVSVSMHCFFLLGCNHFGQQYTGDLTRVGTCPKRKV